LPHAQCNSAQHHKPPSNVLIHVPENVPTNLMPSVAEMSVEAVQPNGTRMVLMLPQSALQVSAHPTMIVQLNTTVVPI